MRRRVVLGFAFVFCLAATLQATEVIVVGAHTLQPNMAGQVINIMVTSSSGTANAQGLSFYVQVADGGPAAGGVVVGPHISGTIIAPGELFAPNNSGVSDSNPGNTFGFQEVLLDTTTSAGTIPQTGTQLLGQITVDTTGFNGGTWALIMSATAAGAAGVHTLPDVGNQITDGSITIQQVPEPASVVLGLFAAAGLGAVAIRKRRARRA